MRWSFVLIILLSLARLSPAHAAGDEQYVAIYQLIQEADQLLGTAQSPQARQKYLDALAGLKALQKSSPEWNPKTVQFRVNYVNDKLAGLGGVAVPESTAPAVVAPGKAPSTPDPTAPFRETIARLEADKALLNAKLQEALAAQPAAADPRELQKAEERVKALEKEKDLALAGLQQAEAKAKDAVDKSMLEQAQAKAAKLEQDLKARDEAAIKAGLELSQLKAALEQARTGANDTPALKEAQAKIAMLTQQVAAKQAQTSSLGREKEKLDALQAENDILKRHFASLAAAPAALPPSAPIVAPQPTAPGASESVRVKNLEQERDELLRRLNEANKELYDAKMRVPLMQGGALSNQVAVLRARLEVFEARKIPYTPEELALFKESPVELADRSSRNRDNDKSRDKKKTARELPSGAAPLIADGQRAFAAGKFDEAEQKYLEVLKLDAKNPDVLGNLAAIHLQQNRLADAESRLSAALAFDANDPHAQSLMGIVRFRQDKFDEALDYLSKAATADPKDAETQNYLGITLSQKGQRGTAETALRRAIQLNPAYAAAHYNLAVAYATAQPPAPELARFHYQKSLALGHPPSPSVEQMLNGK